MTDVPLPDPSEARDDGAHSGTLARIMPLLTLVIAVVAIALATWEGLENRRHNRMTVKPSLGAAIDAGRNAESEYARMSVESNGLGPAVVTVFEVYFDGERLSRGDEGPDRSIWQPLLDAAGDDGLTEITARGMGNGYYLRGGEEYVVFEARRPISSGGVALTTLLDRLAIRVCYCSIYDTDCGGMVLAMRQTDIEPCPAD